MKYYIILFYTAVFFTSCTGVEIYKNNKYSPSKRADDLISRLTLEEKVGLMQDRNIAIERLDIKEYNWWNEALHGVARAGLATVYPQPIGMAASFDKDLVFDVFDAISDEARAKNSYFASIGSYGRYEGLTMWTPTINIFRDPRWGRGMESYGEDPYLTAQLGVAVVRGLQGEVKNGYQKLQACAKHFAVHSGPEWNRHSFDAKNIDSRDLYETYLPAFEALVKEANVRMVMCAYNRFEGEPCCGSNQLLVDILRNKWGFDGVVVSDCGAIRDFFDEKAHAVYPNAAEASAKAVLTGTDLDCGSSYRALIEAVNSNLITEEDINISVKRLLKARLELGELDNPKEVGWSSIPYSVVGSKEHRDLSLKMAQKSMVLLKNDGILPLKNENSKIAVMGPNANDSIMQWGNYNGTPTNTITILEGIKSIAGSENVIYEKTNSWVENTLLESAFNQCFSNDKVGFSAKYWNNLKKEGNPEVETIINSPFNFCTSGATVFEPGVNLTDFSAKYTSTFKPQISGEVFLSFYVNGLMSVKFDGVDIMSDYKTNHGSRKQEKKVKVEAGKEYEIEIDFTYYRPDAELNFDIGYKSVIDIDKSIAKVKDAEIVIYVGGISPSLEGEEMGVRLPGFHRGDRTNIELPKIQKDILKALYKAGKKIIYINCSGSAIALTDEIEVCSAILQAWYPGQEGGNAVAKTIFGEYNPAGRLPVTFYKNSNQLLDFEDYSMRGKTYRYFEGEVLFPFGYGLSYSDFEYKYVKFNSNVIKDDENFKLAVTILNNSEYDGEEVVQLYIKRKDDIEGPVKTLRDFQRVFIPKGETTDVHFILNRAKFEWWDEATQTMNVRPGLFDVYIGKSSKIEELQKVEVELK